MGLIQPPYLKIEPALWSNPTIITPNKMEMSDSINIYVPIITMINPIDNSETIITDYHQLILKSMDDNIFVEVLTETIMGVQYTTGYKLTPVREGSSTVEAYYTHTDGTKIYGETEIVCYKPWFRDNYWQLISEVDASNIGTGPQQYDDFGNPKSTYADIVLKTCMEMYDILWAYNQDVLDITDPLFAKNKFVDIIGKSRGFIRTDLFHEQQSTEYFATQLYRELLNNLFELLSIRGTRLSYEMFFGALGYDIELLEFWFNEEGQLVHINPDDNEETINSTFDTYDITGRLLSNSPQFTDDPRYFNDANKPVNYCQKSYFIKPKLTAKEGFDFGELGGYAIEQKQIIWQYLNYLRPIHIEYLDEILNYNVNSTNPAGNTEFYYLCTDEDILTGPMTEIIALLMPRYTINSFEPFDATNDIRPVLYNQQNPSSIRYLDYNYSTDNREYSNKFDTLFEALSVDVPFNNPSNMLLDNLNYADVDLPAMVLEVASKSRVIKLSSIHDFDNNLLHTLNNYGSQANMLTYTVNVEVSIDPAYVGQVNLMYREKINGWTEWRSTNIGGFLVNAPFSFSTTDFGNLLFSWDYLGNNAEIEIKIENNTDQDANIRIYYCEAKATYYMADRLGNQIAIDPGGLNYSAGVTRGTFHRDKLATDDLMFSMSGGGLAVEHLWKCSNNINDLTSWQDLFIISQNLKLSDSISTYVKYDSIPPDRYDASGLKYDTGHALLDASPPAGASADRTIGIIPVDIKIFQTEYNKIPGSDDFKRQTILNNPKYIGLSRNTFDLIMNYTI